MTERSQRAWGAVIGLALLCSAVLIDYFGPFSQSAHAMNAVTPEASSHRSSVVADHIPSTPMAVLRYTTERDVVRCYLVNLQGGQPLQIECPK